MQELAAREHEVVQERVAVVVFVRALGKNNHEVSAYIDFHQRYRPTSTSTRGFTILISIQTPIRHSIRGSICTDSSCSGGGLCL